MMAEVAPLLDGSFSALVNLGALGILGYHLLWGLPKLFDKINENAIEVAKMLQANAAAERTTFEARDAALRAEIAQLRNAARCRYDAPSVD